MESFYPEEVSRRSRLPKQAGVPSQFDAKGTGASLECGMSVRIFLRFSAGSGVIEDARFVSNGCGWAVAAAEVISESVTGSALKDLGALDSLPEKIRKELGEIPTAREKCVEMGLESLRKALADHREMVAEEWTGEKALICSCFGVSEDTIESLAVSGDTVTVESVGEECGAGTGCGSCQMLIREIIDSVNEGPGMGSE